MKKVNNHYGIKMINSRIQNIVFLLIILFTSCQSIFAFDSSDLLFHLSFDDGVLPELAHGSGEIVQMPPQLSNRIVQGLIGKAYLFGGKDSTLEYYTGEHGLRGCFEMYGQKKNFFADSGTLSFWVAYLPNMNNMTHYYFKYGGDFSILRNQYTHNWYTFGSKSAVLFDVPIPYNVWVHVAVAWQNGKCSVYLNGEQRPVVDDVGSTLPTLSTFIFAREGISSLDMQTKEFADDTLIDEIQVFRRPLSVEEIQSLYERGNVAFTMHQGIQSQGKAYKPERIYGANKLVAPLVNSPIKVDGDMSDWGILPQHGCLIDRRIGVMDEKDEGKVYVACDKENLYMGFYCQVDESIRSDPTHIWYPTGEFLAGIIKQRDGNVYADDYVEFVIVSMAGDEYRFIFNAKGALLDKRNGDAVWDSNVVWKSRSNFTEDWTAELAIPLSELGLKIGDSIGFNAVRSWKLFRSAENSLFTDEKCQPSVGVLLLGNQSAASIESFGTPSNGKLDICGTIDGKPGDYTVSIEGNGYKQTFKESQKVVLTDKAVKFEFNRKLQAGDMSVIVRLNDPEGKEILTRTVPFVYAPSRSIELASYPGYGILEVVANGEKFIDQLGTLNAVVCIKKNGESLSENVIPKFNNFSEKVSFDISKLEVGTYQVVVRLLVGDKIVDEASVEYEKKPFPEWYDNKIGVRDVPPKPWTDIEVKGNKIKCLIKEIEFNGTIFPSQIISNTQKLLSRPVCIRIMQNGKERKLDLGDFSVIKHTPRKVEWKGIGSSGDISVVVDGWIEFDGFTWMDITLSGGQVDHLSLDIPLTKDAAELQTLSDDGIVVGKVMSSNGYIGWVGNAKGGIQYLWEHQKDWVQAGEATSLVPYSDEVVITIPIIQKPVDLQKSRTVTLGWAITPSKPLRKDWRDVKLYKQINYFSGGYTSRTPNYPEARDEDIPQFKDIETKERKGEMFLWYAFGPFMWLGSPEYAEWWREWRWTPSEQVLPNRNSTEWGHACHNSSSADLFIWKLNKFIHKYPQNSIYFDCMGAFPCDNIAHGCGYVDENGIRKTTMPILASRRYYERIWNVMKEKTPTAWIRFHDWIPNMAISAFCDENWYGEALIAPIASTPEKNYYHVMPLPQARLQLSGEHWGYQVNWLTELAVHGGTDHEKRAEWFGKMIEPPSNGKRGKWILPKWEDYEHVAGLYLVHDMWKAGGNDLEVPVFRLEDLQREMKWSSDIQFIGYWAIGDALEADGLVPNQVVCSIYYRPAKKNEDGSKMLAMLMLVTMNNTDNEVTVTLRPNLGKFDLEPLKDGELLDIYRSDDYVFDAGNHRGMGSGMGQGWVANVGDPESPIFCIKGERIVYPLNSGAAKVIIPKRNFRALLLKARE